MSWYCGCCSMDLAMNLKHPPSVHYKVEVTVVSHDSGNLLFSYGCHGNFMGLCL